MFCFCRSIACAWRPRTITYSTVRLSRHHWWLWATAWVLTLYTSIVLFYMTYWETDRDKSIRRLRRDCMDILQFQFSPILAFAADSSRWLRNVHCAMLERFVFGLWTDDCCNLLSLVSSQTKCKHGITCIDIVLILRVNTNVELFRLWTLQNLLVCQYRRMFFYIAYVNILYFRQTLTFCRFLSWYSFLYTVYAMDVEYIHQ